MTLETYSFNMLTSPLISTSPFTSPSSSSCRYYSASIISMAGVRNPATAIWLAAATSSVNFFGTFIGLVLVERAGRRWDAGSWVLCSN